LLFVGGGNQVQGEKTLKIIWSKRGLDKLVSREGDHWISPQKSPNYLKNVFCTF
jgi:hypothetical protein